MNLTIDEIATRPNSTASVLYVDKAAFCFIIEDGYRDEKIPGVTRIPGGRYQVIQRKHGGIFHKYAKKYGHKFVPEIKGVPNYSDVLFHIGNFASDTRGCALTNRTITFSPSGEFEGANSEAAYLGFYKLIDAAFDRGEEVFVDVVRREIIDESIAG